MKIKQHCWTDTGIVLKTCSIKMAAKAFILLFLDLNVKWKPKPASSNCLLYNNSTFDSNTETIPTVPVYKHNMLIKHLADSNYTCSSMYCRIKKCEKIVKSKSERVYIVFSAITINTVVSSEISHNTSVWRNQFQFQGRDMELLCLHCCRSCLSSPSLHNVNVDIGVSHGDL